jgi:hypothetical protein
LRLGRAGLMNGPNEIVAHFGYYVVVAGRSDPVFSDDATALIDRTATPRPAPLDLLSASTTRSAAPYSQPSCTQPARASPAPKSPGARLHQ